MAGVGALRARIQELEDEVAVLRAVLLPEPLEPPPCPLTPLEHKLLRALRAAHPGVLTRRRALAALYGGTPDAPDDAIIDVTLSTLRRKLRRAGLDGMISTYAGRGWHLKASAVPRLSAAAAEEVWTCPKD